MQYENYLLSIYIVISVINRGDLKYTRIEPLPSIYKALGQITCTEIKRKIKNKVYRKMCIDYM